ncbi:MAG: two-component system response regulator [Deltaproteobacteria bacterium]|jgi:DNA-binding NtrC family response regulator|nr:two-component system response regulator [Deltaproteobacteria bacterium]
MAGTQPLNVLVVEPDVQTRGQLAHFLHEEGYRATSLEEPRRIAHEVKNGRYQMVILDLGRPGEGGLDLLQDIRSVDDDLCVICMTDEPSVETAVATMKHRAFDYLEKPVVASALRPVLQAAVKEHGLAVDPEERLNLAIGERIRARRHELSLTLKQVANRTGLSVSLISQIELGKSAASVMTLYKVAAALGVRVAVFFEAV